MTKKGREFNEILDLTAMRVIVGSVKDCYGAIGIIHSLWKPLPGRFKDFVAMPKANMYQALHTTVIGPEGKPLEIQIRTAEMHELAEYGIAAHVAYKEGGQGDPRREKMTWLRQVVEHEGEQDPAEFLESLKVDLFEDEVFVFTPKGEVKNLSGGSTPARLRLRRPHRRRPPLRRRQGQRQDRAAPLPAAGQGDIVEVLTAKRERGPSRDWLKLVRTSRARNKIRAWFKEERREDAERHGREVLEQALRKRGLPMQKLAMSPLLADVFREMGFRKATDFYIALGQGKISAKTVANKLMQRLKAGEAVEENAPLGPDRQPRGRRAPHQGGLELRDPGQGRRRRRGEAGEVLPAGPGRRDRRLRIARPRDHDPSRGLQERPGAEEGAGAVRRRRAGTGTTRPPTGSSSRSTPGTARACSRTSRGPSPRPGSTSSRRAARPSTRWSRTASWSRSATPSS